MEANELRVVNFVKCKTSNDSGVYTVLAIDGLNLKIYLSEPRSKWHSEDLIKPIPITEEWLRKFGFVLDDMSDSLDDNTWYSLSYAGFKFESDKSCNFSEVFVSIRNTQIRSVKYVHQLQNLYFELTGKKLEITTK